MKTSMSQEQGEKSSFFLSFREPLMRVLIGNNKNVLFSFSPQNCERSAASRLLKQKSPKITSWDNQKGVVWVTAMLKH